MNITQRINRRIQCEADISHDIVIPDIWYTGKIYNFCKQGLYFESNEHILPGDEISITIKKLPQKNIADIQQIFAVEILWCKESKDSSFRYGYGARLIKSNRSLIKLFDSAEFNKIELNNYDQKNEEDGQDPRAYTRKICNRKIKLVNNRQIWEGFVTNISRGGAFIESEKRFPFGAKITLIVSGKKFRKDVKLKGWVVRMGETGIGVKFDLRSGRKRRGDLDRRVALDRRVTR